MNIEELIKDSVKILNSIQKLPYRGLLAGGSLCNVILYKLYKQEYIINDIDIFILNSEKPYVKSNLDIKHNLYLNTKNISNENYNIDIISAEHENYYSIVDVREEQLLNYIYYDCKEYDPFFVIDNFDLNCCCVGYDLRTEKCYYNDAFIEFLKTKILRFNRLHTPSHAIVRMFKKQEETLSIIVPNELEIIKPVTYNIFYKTTKLHFGEKRYLDYLKYEKTINKYFKAIKIEIYKETFIYRLVDIKIYEKLKQPYSNIFVIHHTLYNYGISKYPHYKQFYFLEYYENYINDKITNKEVYHKIPLFYRNDNFLDTYDGNIDSEYLKFIEQLNDKNSLSLYTLKDYNFSDMCKLYDHIKIIGQNNDMSLYNIIQCLHLNTMKIHKDISYDELEYIILTTFIYNRYKI